MKLIRPFAVCLSLAVAAAGQATAQAGRGMALGFTGIGLGNWALYEGGADSIAAWYQLTEEQRGLLEQTAAQFRSENADAVERWRQMQVEIQQLWTGNQPPTQAAIYSVGEKYGHPGLELQPALDQLQIQSTALITPAQWQFYGRRSFAQWGGGRGMRGAGRGFASRRYNAGYGGFRQGYGGFRRGYGAFRGRPRAGFNRWPGGPPPDN